MRHKNIGAVAKRVAVLGCEALVGAGNYPCRQSIAAKKIMANKAQAKIFSAVRSASDDLHIGARQRLSLGSTHAQDVAAGFKAYIKVAVRTQHRGIGNVAGNTAAGQSLPPRELIAAKNFCVNRIHGAMAASSRGKVMQSEDPFMLIPVMTVAENIVLATEPVHNGVLLDYDVAGKRVQEISPASGSPSTRAPTFEDITVGQQQRVEILKALYRGADILVLDEPTAVLTPQEAQELFAIVKSLTDQGKSIIFISHKLNEVPRSPTGSPCSGAARRSRRCPPQARPRRGWRA